MKYLIFILIWIAIGIQIFRFLSDPLNFAIDKVEIRQVFHNLDKEQLQKNINAYLQGSFFSLNLKQLKQAITALPWVADAQIRRLWPAKIQVELVPQKAIAQWGDQGLINEKGEVFFPKQKPKLGLILIGSQEKIGIMLAFYHKQKPLFAAKNMVIEQIKLNARGEWELKLKDGTEIIIGKQQVDKRIKQLLDVYSELKFKNLRPQRFDLRYEQGFAIRWQQEGPSE